MAQRIVTVNSLPAAAAGGLEKLPSTPDQRLLKARHDEIVRQIEEEARKVDSEKVMVTLPDREISRFQSELARQASETREGASGALEARFATGLGGGDWWGWVKSVLDWVDRDQAHEQVRPVNASPTDLTADYGNRYRIAMAGDWGTGLYGAPKIADQIRRAGGFDLLLHLGDVYYSGTVEEVQERLLDPWPREAGKVSRTLNANHEMYSGGYGYFDHALPAFGQPSSYFALQNDHWLLVALDTAYVDHDIDSQQVGWLNTVISGAENRKVVFFSHQQLFSRLGEQGPKLRKALRSILATRVVKAWYWAHEHQCTLYDAQPDYGLFARCLGNGGIPEPRKSEVRQAPAERTLGEVSWKRLGSTADSPSCLVLDGPNRFVEGEEEKFGPHGYMTLDFDGPVLTERVFLADGTQVHELGIS